MKRELVGRGLEELLGAFKERIHNNLAEETKSRYKGLSRAGVMYYD